MSKDITAKIDNRIQDNKQRVEEKLKFAKIFEKELSKKMGIGNISFL